MPVLKTLMTIECWCHCRDTKILCLCT